MLHNCVLCRWPRQTVARSHYKPRQDCPCVSRVCSHGTARLQLEKKFFWTSIFWIFTCQLCPIFLKVDKVTDTVHEDLCICISSLRYCSLYLGHFVCYVEFKVRPMRKQLGISVIQSSMTNCSSVFKESTYKEYISIFAKYRLWCTENLSLNTVMCERWNCAFQIFAF